MVHPQREHNSLSKNGKNDRALRWKNILDANVESMRVFMFVRDNPL